MEAQNDRRLPSLPNIRQENLYADLPAQRCLDSACIPMTCAEIVTAEKEASCDKSMSCADKSSEESNFDKKPVLPND